MPHRFSLILSALAVLVLVTSPVLQADEAATLEALAQMPVREVTVFKDGHAVVIHEGQMATDADGNVLLDYLPTPLLGTFWPYVTDKDVKLSSTVASPRRVKVERTALDVPSLIEGNPGADVIITEQPLAVTGVGIEARPLVYEATIVGVPNQSGKEQEAVDPPGSGQKLPIKGSVVELKTTDGVRVVALNRIVDVVFRKDHAAKLAQEEFRNLLTLHLDWSGAEGAKARPKAAVGMMYVQQGLRWIPEYKVTIDGKGNAEMVLQATLINELTDMEDVTAHLVIGVPSFDFKDMVDPMSLQQTLAHVANTGGYDNNGMRQALQTNRAIMAQSQFAAGAAMDMDMQRSPEAGPQIKGSEKHEDLFVFDVKHVTLKKGQRMVLPVTHFTVPYRDVYTLDIPAVPPRVVRGMSNNPREAEIEKMLHAPKVIHKIRLSNKSDFPITTAPALIIKDGRVLSQGMTTYTSRGSESDLELTTAVDVRVKLADKETKRNLNAETWNGQSLTKLEMAGSIALTSFSDKQLDIEVTKHVLGNTVSADNDGKAEMISVFENDDSGARPEWWNYYSWPQWWDRFNGMGKFTWNVKLDPAKSVELKYVWYYYAW